MANPLLEVQKYGQSIWFDNIRRGLIISGELAHMVERDGLTGVTSNPAIFEKAIAGSNDYDQALKALIAKGVETSQDLYERLAIQDIQLAADILYPVYIRTGGRDGYVSLEVSPYLAGDTRDTLEEARRLHSDVRRDNLMIKVPATPAGIPAIRQLVAEGISVNATLLFDVAIYEQVADAYMAGLEAYGAKGGEVARVASVASFFVSRIDTLVDAQLEKLLDECTDVERRRKLKPLIGKVAIANARLAYARYRALVASERWQKLAASGAYPQRLLWASTGTKNPRYSRTVYVEELIGPDTVNTIPAETYVAFREGGKVRPSLTENWAENLDHAREMVQILAEAGLPLQEATRSLLAEGVTRFCEPFDRLLAAVERKRQTQLNAALDPQTFALGEHAPAVARTLEAWRVEGKVRRLWNGDASLWTGTDEGTWLGWLHAPEAQLDQQASHAALAESLRQAGYRHVVVLGMGGSALSPEVFARLFGPAPGCPDMVVLDSIAPAEVLAVANAIEPARTLFIVSSKSGGTVETNALFQFFFERVRRAVGFEKAGSHFLAITDPKTRLHVRAKAERFRHIAFSWPATSGRFASLSNLGMLPASLLGVQTTPLLETTLRMVHSCASCVPPELNPGVRLGVTLGTLARVGRDKLTLILDPVLATFGPWLEQLVSESTGKAGQGIVVIDGETPGAPGVYGSDRVFVSISLRQSQPPAHRASLDALEKAGHPVIRITMHDKLDLGQEMFRWQMATAVAGAVLGINPFNMPDVEASKVAARARADTWESPGGLPSEPPLAQEGGLSLFADPHNAEALLAASAGSRTVEALLRAHLARLQPGDYLALNAFLPATPQTRAPLTDLRQAIRDRRQVATMLGFSPRLLHSTGQLHKGGPASGLFLHLTADEPEDVPIPGQKFTLGALHLAQALGDFDVLAQRGRRLLRIHLGADLASGLAALRDLTLRLLV